MTVIDVDPALAKIATDLAAENAALRTEVARLEQLRLDVGEERESQRRRAEAAEAERDAAIREREIAIAARDSAEIGCAEACKRANAARSRLEEALTLAAEVCCSACGYQITGEEGRPEPECRTCGPLLASLSAPSPGDATTQHKEG